MWKYHIICTTHVGASVLTFYSEHTSYTWNSNWEHVFWTGIKITFFMQRMQPAVRDSATWYLDKGRHTQKILMTLYSYYYVCTKLGMDICRKLKLKLVTTACKKKIPWTNTFFLSWLNLQLFIYEVTLDTRAILCKPPSWNINSPWSDKSMNHSWVFSIHTS